MFVYLKILCYMFPSSFSLLGLSGVMVCIKKWHHLLRYSVSQENPDSDKNMLLLKNPQFLPNHYETLSKCGPHEYLILTKFPND